MSYIIDNIYYYLGYENEITPDPKIIKQRHLLMKQIKLSNFKLKKIELKRENKDNIIPRFNFKRKIRKK